jgi:hypothetical protein
MKSIIEKARSFERKVGGAAQILPAGSTGERLIPYRLPTSSDRPCFGESDNDAGWD